VDPTELISFLLELSFHTMGAVSIRILVYHVKFPHLVFEKKHYTLVREPIKSN
jgi:hypothetical protein